MDMHSAPPAEVPMMRWIEIAQSIFPSEAQITHPPAGASVWLRIRWKVRNDPKRPHKPARGVNIYFTREFCKAYEALDPAGQAAWDGKVRAILSGRYAAFDPDHNAPHGTPMPTESWFVTPGAIR